jgi:hypothetical protein
MTTSLDRRDHLTSANLNTGSARNALASMPVLVAGIDHQHPEAQGNM